MHVAHVRVCARHQNLSVYSTSETTHTHTPTHTLARLTAALLIPSPQKKKKDSDTDNCWNNDLDGTGSARLESALPMLSWPGDIVWSQETFLLIAGVALTVAMVGLIESLMTLQLIDDMTETRGQGNRECFGIRQIRNRSRHWWMDSPTWR